jgi:hypothetical protein
MAGKKLSAIEAVVKVLTDSGKPMRVPDIIKEAVPLTNLGGKTPGQTIYSVLYAEAKKKNARVKRVGRGEFKAVPQKAEAQAKSDPKPNANAKDKAAAAA